MDKPEVMTVNEAALYLRVSHMTIRRAIAAGKLPAAKIGSQWRIKRVDLERLLEPGPRPELPPLEDYKRQTPIPKHIETKRELPPLEDCKRQTPERKEPEPPAHSTEGEASDA